MKQMIKNRTIIIINIILNIFKYSLNEYFEYFSFLSQKVDKIRLNMLFIVWLFFFAAEKHWLLSICCHTSIVLHYFSIIINFE